MTFKTLNEQKFTVVVKLLGKACFKHQLDFQHKIFASGKTVLWKPKYRYILTASAPAKCQGRQWKASSL